MEGNNSIVISESESYYRIYVYPESEIHALQCSEVIASNSALTNAQGLGNASLIS